MLEPPDRRGVYACPAGEVVLRKTVLGAQLTESLPERSDRVLLPASVGIRGAGRTWRIASHPKTR